MIHTLVHQFKRRHQTATFAVLALFLIFGGTQDAKAQTYAGYTAAAGWNTIVNNTCGNTNWPNANMIGTDFAATNVNGNGFKVEGTFQKKWTNGTGVDALILTKYNATPYSIRLKLDDGTYTAPVTYTQAQNLVLSGTFTDNPFNCNGGVSGAQTGVTGRYTPIDFASFSIPAGRSIVGSEVEGLAPAIVAEGADISKFIITTNAVEFCAAGANAPTFAPGTTFTNTCPSNKVNLNSFTATNLPANTSLTWHTATPATNSNKLTSAQASAVVGGTYYAAFFDASNNCYSGTAGNGTTLVVATIASCGTTDYCGYVAGEGCSTTDYSNYGLNSNSDAASIEYDNFVSVFHSTIVRTTSGKFNLWGEYIANNGTSAVLSPIELNSTNYPALGTHKVLKVTGAGLSQFVALTTDGLYAWASTGKILSTSLKSTTAFGKVSPTNGNNFSLPAGLTPADIKMFTASEGKLVITTCSGNVWILTNSTAADVSRGITTYTSGDENKWFQANTAANTPLTNIVAARVNQGVVMALDNSNNIWTWGTNSLLGNGSGATSRNFATKMTLPATGKTVKMIGLTSSTASTIVYYVLMTDGNLYAVGANGSKELGDWTTTAKTSWTQPRYSSASGPVMNNIAWISPQQYEQKYGAINVITNMGTLYAWGSNHFNLLGRDAVAQTVDPGIPAGISSTDKILTVATSGHTSMVIKDCEDNLGYVGHRVNGSMGDGTATSFQENTYTFTNTPVLSICGVETVSGSVSTPSNPDGTYCINKGPLTLVGYPAGGTFSIVSGTGATISDNQLTFSATSTVTLSLSYTATSSCGTPVSTTFTMTGVACCLAGDTAPTLSATSITNTCPSVDINLNSLVTSSAPTGASLVWFTNNAHTGTAYASATMAAPGTYYAFYFDSANNCYSPASAAVTATVTNCCQVQAVPNFN